MDIALLIGQWDFNLSEIAVPVQVWYGEQDHNASLGMYRYLTETIPLARPNLIPGEGHISLIVKHAEDILRALI